MKTVNALFSAFFLFIALCGTTAFAQPAKNAQDEQPSAEVVVGDKLNINAASAEEIEKSLLGIGAKKAQAVVEYREKHGNFTALEQLLEVQGIGKATLDKNRARIRLN
ncbi:ComEA family DNA-binding protein [Necropsobacter massiliensis]|uniref:ComEA family DNA-binding protein n=1 Tax=Necropsobacter massiliensis TaxID=1400001 RepID=UPI0005962211|nr:helix-hairpin-helix domain-containing protein [Necropsobacter massiliensis]